MNYIKKKFERILELCEARNYLIAINELKILIQYLETKKKEIEN